MIFTVRRCKRNRTPNSAEAIAKGRGKMPSYEKSLKEDDIKALVPFLRTLGKQ